MYSFLVGSIMDFLSHGDEQSLQTLQMQLNMIDYNEKELISELLSGLLKTHEIQICVGDSMAVKIKHVIALTNPNVFC